MKSISFAAPCWASLFASDRPISTTLADMGTSRLWWVSVADMWRPAAARPTLAPVVLAVCLAIFSLLAIISISFRTPSEGRLALRLALTALAPAAGAAALVVVVVVTEAVEIGSVANVADRSRGNKARLRSAILRLIAHWLLWLLEKGDLATLLGLKYAPVRALPVCLSEAAPPRASACACAFERNRRLPFLPLPLVCFILRAYRCRLPK